jgi:hypothetical protein
MSEPEIARRCSHCGVTLRQRAMFCPQCGQKIDDYDLRDTQLLEPRLADTQIIERQAGETQLLESPARDVQPTEDPSLTMPALTGVSHNVRDRVEKIKHVSHVVIDQAAYDPSLRFILVAAVIFVVFLLVVILSKVIG